MIETTLTYLTEADSLAAIAYLNEQPDPASVLESYLRNGILINYPFENLP